MRAAANLIGCGGYLTKRGGVVPQIDQFFCGITVSTQKRISTRDDPNLIHVRAREIFNHQNYFPILRLLAAMCHGMNSTFMPRTKKKRKKILIRSRGQYNFLNRAHHIVEHFIRTFSLWFVSTRQRKLASTWKYFPIFIAKVEELGFPVFNWGVGQLWEFSARAEIWNSVVSSLRMLVKECLP